MRSPPVSPSSLSLFVVFSSFLLFFLQSYGDHPHLHSFPHDALPIYPLRSSISVHTDVTIEHGRPVPRREPMAQPHKDHRVVDLMSRRGVMGLGATAAALGLGAWGDADPDVASAPPDSDTDLSGSLVLWAYPMDQANDAEWYQPHIDSFQEKFPGIDVEVVMQPWEGREEQLTASITGGNAPDVVYMTPDFLPRFANEELLVSLDELRDWSTFTPESMEPLRFDGSLYAAPVLIQAAQTFANKRLLNELGVEGPTTWDEMRTVGEIAAEAGYYLTQYNGDETLNQNYYMYLWQAGGDVLTGEDRQGRREG